MTGFITTLAAAAFGQQFRDVSTEAGMIAFETRSWGSPIWGDLNHDGWLDLIVPTHELQLSGGPFVYLNNRDGTFADIRPPAASRRSRSSHPRCRAISGLKKAPTHDTQDWLGYAFGDYDADGNLDLYIAEGSFGYGARGPKRDLLFKGHGDGTFENVTVAARIEISEQFGESAFWVGYDRMAP